ncbi:MAG: TonB-dependent siderophore receptor [Pseudomonadota bacterium]
MTSSSLALRNRPLIGITTLLMATTSALTLAFAQEASDTSAVELNPIVILGQEDATGPVGDDPNPLTVTGSKVPLRTNEIPQSVTVIGAEKLKEFNARRVSEALRYIAGVTTDVFGDDGDYDWLRIRGFQADQTGIYLDNAQNLAFAFGSFYIDPYTLERIEVLRGPSSALYGGSNPGGIVNYVSKRPGVRVREVIVGGNDAASGWGAFDVGDSIGDRYGYRLTGRIEGGDKYDDLNEGVRGTLAPSFKFATDMGTEVTLLANLHLADEKHNGSTFLPYVGTVTPTAQFGFIDDDANFSDPDWDDYNRQQALLSAIVEHQFSNGFTFTGNGRAGIASVEETYWYPFGYAGFSPTPVDAQGTLSLLAFEHDTLVRTAQTDLRYYGEVETGFLSHYLLFGLDARYYWLDETQAVAFGTNSVVNPIAPGTPVLAPPFQDAVTTQRQIGLYFQDQIRFGDGWITTLNFRHDFVETEQDGAFAFARSDSEPSYRTALAYAFDNGITPYVSYSSFFNPLIASPANGVTEPESGDQIEGGVKWAPEGGNFALATSAFLINRENVVTGVFPNFDQLGEVRVKGLEFEGTYDFGFGLTVGGALTVLDAEIEEDSNATLIGKTPTLIPEWQASLKAEYAFAEKLKGLKIGAGVRHQGESYADAANTLSVDDFTLFDAYASYDLGERFSANFSVTNIADKRHVTGCQTVFVCSYGSGREFSFSLTSTF